MKFMTNTDAKAMAVLRLCCGRARGCTAQQSRGGKKLFFDFLKFYQNMKIHFTKKQDMKFCSNVMPISIKKKHFKVAENTACLPEAVIYEVKKGVKES